MGKVTLTFLLALAKLLTEILGHHARAGAVAWMIGVITWLVVVHLIGRVIWSNGGQNTQNGTVSWAVFQRAKCRDIHAVVDEHTFF